MEFGATGVQVRCSPAFGPTLRTKYGSGLSVFLATCLQGDVPAKVANHRIGGQRVARDLGRMQNFTRRHRRLPGLIVVGFGQFWVRGLPFPNARHLGHPFHWKNTLPWHLEHFSK